MRGLQLLVDPDQSEPTVVLLDKEIMVDYGVSLFLASSSKEPPTRIKRYLWRVRKRERLYLGAFNPTMLGEHPVNVRLKNSSEPLCDELWVEAREWKSIRVSSKATRREPAIQIMPRIWKLRSNQQRLAG